MLRILVADDERLIRTGLEDLLNAEPGFTVVKAASNGEEALDAVRRERPDVVLTDIRMPRMDGRELVRELHRCYPEIRKVIISGYEDFNYAHETMKNGAIDYLLKPVDEKELIELLRRIEAEVRAEDQRRSDDLKVQERLDQSLQLLRGEFLRSLLRGNVMTDGEIAERLEYLSVEPGEGPYCAAFVSFCGGGPAPQTADALRATMECLKSAAGVLLCEDEGGVAVILSRPGGGDGEPWYADAALGELYEALRTDLKCKFTLSAGNAVKALSAIRESYLGARQAQKRGFGSSAEKPAAPLADAVSRKDRKRVEVVREYVEKNYRENITLARISELVYVNPNYFCEMFKSQTGENFVDYLTRVRVEKAKALLRDVKIKTYEVGALVGYEDSGYFCKVFKKFVGITPGQYRDTSSPAG